MPDLTLYREDVEFIRDALAEYAPTFASNDSGGFEAVRLRDVLTDRLVQGLHPTRPVEPPS